VESRPGVGIDPKTHSNQKSIFFAGEYLRLKQNAGLTGFAECVSRGEDNRDHDMLEIMLEGKKNLPLLFGGQRGVAYLEAKRLPAPFSRDISHIQGRFLKWILLSPAVFVNGLKTNVAAHGGENVDGWLPGWIQKGDDDEWQVQLKNRPERQPGERRDAWRERLNAEPPIGAKLMAACLGKPRHFSGWRILDGVSNEPARTWMAVPEGSVYYFECDSEEESRKLAAQLHGQTKSDMLGEQGFGFGVCGTWEPAQ
jgi:CRISPR-associated protein Cmr3